MRTLKAALVVAALSIAQAATGDGLSLNLRALQPLPESAIQVIADLGAPTVLSKSDYPDAKHFSGRKIIDVLCGSYRDDYWQAALKANNLKQLPATQVLGERVYAIKWPACAYVLQPSQDHPLVVHNKTNAWDLYKELTGARGNAQSIKYYFRNSSVPDITKVSAGEPLIPSHVTVAKPIYVANKTVFLQAMNTATAGNDDKFIYIEGNAASSTSSTGTLSLGEETDHSIKNVAGPSFPDSVPSAPARAQLSIAAGRIEALGNAPYQTPTECDAGGVAAQTPFDVPRILAAYDISHRAAQRLHFDQYPTDIFVADNGFFGARRVPSGLQWGISFPETFFYTQATYGDGQIGPTIRSPATTIIYPLNYSDGLSSANFISGHGTHVAGLILGGEPFQTHRSILQRADGRPWLHLIVLNIGRGGAELLPGSEQQLDTQVELQKNKIINLSLEYTDSIDQTAESIFAKMMVSGEQNQNLFVVAAGNDGASDVLTAPYYPASFGGTGMGRTPNVISVAAHRADGTLAAFSNRGADSIDIAAPGCHLKSWLDDTAQVADLSGTSQAAAVVTFAAALIRSLNNADPYSIKTRLMISGDLLNPGTPGTTTPSPQQIMSRSRLNISTALYLFDDYVRYRLPGDTADREAMGQVDGLSGVSCVGDKQDADWSDIWAVKRTASEIWVYRGRKARAVRAPCSGVIKPGATLSLHVRLILGRDGTPATEAAAPAPQSISIPISGLSALVTALPAAQP